ncbi:MAG: hypothetical protein U1E56_09960 [Bauldia sp.]
MLLKVVDVKWLGAHRVRVRFSDGSFEPLRDPDYLASVFLDQGAPT